MEQGDEETRALKGTYNDSLSEAARAGTPEKGSQSSLEAYASMMQMREEDAAQEILVKVMTRLASFRGESSFATWVYRLTTNLCIDYIRRQQRRRETVSAVSLDESDSPFPEPADPGQDPHRALEQTELRRAVERGLQALPEAQRQVLVLRELSGLSYQEIGERLDLDLGTVKSRIARARLALRKILLQDGNFFGTPASNPSEREEKGGARRGAL